MNSLAEHQGSWTGTNGFRLMPTDQPHVAAATADVSAGAGGNLALIAYTWSHPEAGEQSGLLVIGPGEAPGTAVAFWGDSWHQAPTPKTLLGTADSGVVALGYSYAEGWEWRITVDAADAGSLRLRMDNVVPPSVAAQGDGPLAYWAMDADLRRVP
jgi:hypothetical protein